MPEFSAGTVYVQVLPSLDDWGDKVRKQLPNELKKFKATVTVEPDVDTSAVEKALADTKAKITPEFDVDSSKAKREADKAAGAFADAFNRSVKAAVARLPEIELKADSSDVDRSIVQIREELRSLADQRIGIDLGEDEALAKLTALQLRLGQLERTSPNVRIRMDLSQASGELESFRARIAATGAAAERSIDRVREDLNTLVGRRVSLTIDDAQALAEIELIREQLEAISRQTTSVHLRADADQLLARLAVAAAQLREFNRLQAEVAREQQQRTADFAREEADAARGIERIRTALDQLREKRVGLKIDDAEARQQLDLLRAEVAQIGRTSVSIRVEADVSDFMTDAASVEAELAHIDGEDATVDVNADDHGSIDLLGTRVKRLIAFFVGASGAVGGLVAEFAALAAGAAVGAAGLGAVAVGATTIGKAMKAQADASEQAGQSAAQEASQRLSAANRLLDAQDALKAAVTNVADAERTASNNVRSALEGQTRAEESLRAAQLAAVRAQEALTDARKSASRSIEDLQNRVIDDALAQRQAVLDLEDAQTKLAQVQDDPGATERQRAEAQLNFEQAQQHLAEISLSYRRSQSDASDAAKAGVNGSKQVVAAQDNLLSTQRQLRDANQSTVDAERRVQEARLNGAKQIASAQEQVIRATRALSSAEAANKVQAQQQGEAHQKFADALDRLSPQSLRLIEYLRSQSGEWSSLQQASQGFATGLQRGLQTLQPSFGALNNNVDTLSTSAGGFFEVIASGLVGAEPFFDTLAASSRTLLPRFGQSVNRAAGAVGDLVVQLLPLAPKALDTADAFSDLVSDLAPFIAQASGPLLDSLQSIIQNLDFLGPLLADVAGPAGELTDVLVDGLREGFLGLMQDGALADFLQACVDLVGTLAPLIGSAGQLAGVVAHDLTPVIDALNVVLKPLVAIVDGLVGFFARMPSAMSGAIIAFAALKFAAAPIQRMLDGVSRGLTNFGTAAASLGGKLGYSEQGTAKFASTAGKLGNSISNIGKSLPIVGAVLIGFGEVMADHEDKVRRSKERTEEWGAALVASGFKADAIAAQISNLRRVADEWATSGDRTKQSWAQALRQTADDAEASATRQRNAMSQVQIAQGEVTQGQIDYDKTVRDFGPHSAIAQEAHERLIGKVQRFKQAEYEAAQAAKSVTERLQDQQDQMLAMQDAATAKDRAALQLQRANLRIDESKLQAEQARRDVDSAQAKLSQIRAGKGPQSDEAKAATLDLVEAKERVADADISTKEATLDLSSAQSRYVASARDAAVATAKAAGAWDTSSAAIKGTNDGLIYLMQTQDGPLPVSVLSMIAHMSEADRAFYGLGVTVDSTGKTILSLPGAPGQPPVSITFTDNLPEIQQHIATFRDFALEVWEELFGPIRTGGPGNTGPGMNPDRMLELGISKAVSTRSPGIFGQFANPPVRRAGGGPIPGRGSTDSVPAMLTPGEYVWSRPAVRNVGVGAVAAMHSAAVRGYARGGLVGLAAGGTVPAASASTVEAPPLGWFAALVDTTHEITNAVDPLATALRAQLVPSLQDTVDASATLASNAVDHWDLIGQTVQNTVATIVAGQIPTLQAGLAAVILAVNNTAITFATQWAAIQGYASTPVRAIIAGPLNQGLVASWNVIDSTFAVGKPLSPIPIPFAAGGQVVGGKPGKDSVLAYLMPGEFVLPVPMVHQIGMRNLEAARRSVLHGGGVEGLVPGFEAGGAVSKALLFATSQVGKPYVWGGVGPDGYDCTGLLSAVANVALGLSPYRRRMTTADFAPGRGAGGFLPGRGSSFVIGVSGSHAAGTLAGHNIESTTKNGLSGVRVDGDASGALDGQFTKGQFYLPQVGGTFIPGPTGGAPFDLAAFLGEAFASTRDAAAQVATAFAGNTIAYGASIELARMVDAVIGWATGNLGLGGASAGTGPVADQVRAVAARYGWGDGPQWNALSTLIAHESSWNPSAQNPRSTAWGLGQFLDATWAGTGIAKTSNPGLQAEAMMRYIRARYGDPIGAWNFWQRGQWYDDGGYLPPGLSLAYNGTGRPEPVFTDQQWRGLAGHSGGGQFSGSLYLDSGEFLGAVRGEINAANESAGRALARRPRL